MRACNCIDLELTCHHALKRRPAARRHKAITGGIHWTKYFVIEERPYRQTIERVHMGAK